MSGLDRDIYIESEACSTWICTLQHTWRRTDLLFLAIHSVHGHEGGREIVRLIGKGRQANVIATAPLSQPPTENKGFTNNSICFKFTVPSDYAKARFSFRLALLCSLNVHTIGFSAYSHPRSLMTQ